MPDRLTKENEQKLEDLNKDKSGRKDIITRSTIGKYEFSEEFEDPIAAISIPSPKIRSCVSSALESPKTSGRHLRDALHTYDPLPLIYVYNYSILVGQSCRYGVQFI